LPCLGEYRVAAEVVALIVVANDTDLLVRRRR
jgi:hypothetical protein